MAKILIKKNTIDFPFVDDKGEELFCLQFDKTDEGIKNFYKAKDKLEQMKVEVTTEESIDEVIPYIRSVYESILGKGSFDQVYKINPSITIATHYLSVICDAILDDILTDLKANLENKYVQGYLKKNAKDSIQDK